MLVSWVVTVRGLVCTYKNLTETFCLHLQHFSHEEGDNLFLWKNDICLQIHTALQSRRPTLTFSPCENQNSHEVQYSISSVSLCKYRRKHFIIIMHYTYEWEFGCYSKQDILKYNSQKRLMFSVQLLTQITYSIKTVILLIPKYINLYLHT
jgi:hypothetical protein